MKGLCILGSTGSIGVSTLDVVARHPDLYQLVALTANTNSEALYQQCLIHKPEYAVLCDPKQAEQLERKLQSSDAVGVKILSGSQALETVAALPQVDAVMAAIVGAAGLLPSLAAARAGKQVLLANKEALVMSGQLFMQAVVEANAELLPIDSEHNAIFQCMPAGYHAGKRADSVAKILLTASGGPFRTLPVDQLDDVTPEQAVAHPNWDMGQKISVDSATMMNKGLELIEACLLFNIAPEDVQIVIHPQSIIHSMVAYVDGSVLAQMGNPDMRIPIAHALASPQRFDSGAEPLDLFAVQQLNFELPDMRRFPCLALAFEAITAGGAMPTILNAANEMAVDAFLSRRIRFTEIAQVIRGCMQQCPQNAADNLDLVLESDRQAREIAQTYIKQHLI